MTTRITRRSFLQTALTLSAAAPLLGAMRPGHAQPTTLNLAAAEKFSFDLLVERARKMAQRKFEPLPRPMPDVVLSLTYDEWGKIRFDTRYALYADGPGMYPVTFFHLGKFFQTGIRIHVLKDGQSRQILYSNTYFDMPKDSPARKLPDQVGFAGFRLQEARTRPDWRTQDWMAFLGASYFRAIGALNQYGLSARGILIDSAEPTAEEFPDFTDFFIEEGRSEADPVLVYALLDGPSISGAYRFAIRRMEGVVQDVEAALFLRKDIKRLGFAPLTSMFWFGEAEKRRFEDWRPEVHDSDGLAIWTGTGERIWQYQAFHHDLWDYDLPSQPMLVTVRRGGTWMARASWDWLMPFASRIIFIPRTKSFSAGTWARTLFPIRRAAFPISREVPVVPVR